MSQRLIQPGMRAIGRTASGTVVWSIAGGAPTSDDPDDSRFTDDDASHGHPGDEAEEDEDDEDEDDKPKPKKAPKKSSDDDDDDDEAVYTEGDMEKIRRRMRAADQRAARLEQENRQLKVGAKPKADEAPDKAPAADTSEADDKAAKAEARARSLAVQNAFLKANTVNWVDSDDALKFINLDEIDVDDDGTVDRKQLARALKVLAKRKPHLVKPEVQSDADDDGEDGDEAQSGRRTAPAMNGKRKGAKKTPTRQDLAKTFPVLNRR